MTEDAGDIRGIHSERVSAWLAENVDGATAPFDFEIIVGGHSNLTYRVTDANATRFVLRRPPLGAVLETAHDMGREHKIISGVGRTDVPVPRALALCTDDSVNDAPFYVMNFVDGHVLESADLTRKVIPEESQRAALGQCVIDTLVCSHRFGRRRLVSSGPAR